MAHMTKWLHKSATICVALKHDTCIFSHRLRDNRSFKTRDTCLLVVSKVDHSSGIPRNDCNIVNSIICLTATLIGIRAVADGWKSHIFKIQIREPRQTYNEVFSFLSIPPYPRKGLL